MNTRGTRALAGAAMGLGYGLANGVLSTLPNASGHGSGAPEAIMAPFPLSMLLWISAGFVLAVPRPRVWATTVLILVVVQWWCVYQAISGMPREVRTFQRLFRDDGLFQTLCIVGGLCYGIGQAALVGLSLYRFIRGSPGGPG